MRLEITDAGQVSLHTHAITLVGGAPMCNGVLLDARLVARNPCVWEGPGGVRFGLEVEEQAETLRLRCWIEGVAAEALDAFGLRFAVHGARRFLRSGYFSWDGSRYLDLDDEATCAAPQIGFALVQFLSRLGDASLVLGFDRHDRFQQTFTVDAASGIPTLEIATLWDRKTLTEGGRAVGEWLHVIDGAGAEDGLRAWARVVAQAAPTPPRLTAPRITGWCSWYSLYAAITPANLRHHLRTTLEVAQRDDLPLRVFQIDDGFTPEMGDWLETKPQFPDGMAPLLDEIRAAGFTPGLWIAPFMVGNRSRLYADHPDWVVRDAQTGGPLAHVRFYGEFRWHKRSEEYYILDATHPDAFEYLRTVFRTWRRDWGCAYFKTDFMHFGSAYGPDRALWHTPGRARMEIWRSVAEMIREEIGDALWLGCGCPLWTPVGLVDAVRIGRDIGTEWTGTGAQSLLRDGGNRNFANGILWQADPDCLLLRDRFHNLDADTQRALALYAGLTGGLLLTSDDLAEVPPATLALFKFLLGLPPGTCRYPLLGSDDAVLVQVRALDGGAHAVFAFNTGDLPAQRTWPLTALGLVGRHTVQEWRADARPALLDDATAQVDVTLGPRRGRLLVLTAPSASG